MGNLMGNFGEFPTLGQPHFPLSHLPQRGSGKGKEAREFPSGIFSHGNSHREIDGKFFGEKTCPRGGQDGSRAGNRPSWPTDMGAC